MDKFIQSEIEESRIARSILDGQPLNPIKLWHKPGYPTVYNAVCLLAPNLAIQAIDSIVKPTTSPNGQPIFVATVKAQFNNNTRYGAAVSQQPDVAELLAYRNAIRQIITSE